MASSPPLSPKLFTHDLAAYTDTELDQYLEANGGDVDVEDYENLRSDAVLIRRLRDRARERSKVQPPPIDLDNLTARLQHVSANKQAPPASSLLPVSTKDWRLRGSRESTLELNEEDDLKWETEYHDILVSQGGRPSHPVSLGRDVLGHTEYCDILSYWQLYNSDAEGREWKVFESQMGRWKRFRKYQRKNREEGRFLTYVDNLRRSLARHEFARPFELNENPERQDKLTTWIEFLDFEHFFYDKDMRIVKHLQAEYDEAWKELVDSQVLRPDETEEFICSMDSVFQRASERERAEKALEAAKFSVTFAQNAINDQRRSTLSENEAERRLAGAKFKLDAAVKSLESIKLRKDLVHNFLKKTKLPQITNDGKEKKSYLSAKKDAECRSILLRWILQQIPLIELELYQTKMADNNNSLDRSNGRSCDRAYKLSKEQSSEKPERKRRRHDDSADDELPSKRPRYNSQLSSFSVRKTPNTDDGIPTGQSQKSGTTASRVVRGRKPVSEKPGLTTGESGGKSNRSTLNSSQLRKNNSPGVPAVAALELRKEKNN